MQLWKRALPASVIMTALVITGCASTTTPTGPTSAKNADPYHEVCLAEAKDVAEQKKDAVTDQAKKNALIGGGVSGAAAVMTGIGFGINPLQMLWKAAPLIASAAAGSALVPVLYGPEQQLVFDQAYHTCLAQKSLKGKPAS